MLRRDFFHISAFVAGEPGETYCTIPRDHLKLFDKFLGMLINNSNTEFCKDKDDFLFSVDKEYYRSDLQLTTTKALALVPCSAATEA